MCFRIRFLLAVRGYSRTSGESRFPCSSGKIAGFPDVTKVRADVLTTSVDSQGIKDETGAGGGGEVHKLPDVVFTVNVLHVRIWIFVLLVLLDLQGIYLFSVFLEWYRKKIHNPSGERSGPPQPFWGEIGAPTTLLGKDRGPQVKRGV